MKIIAALSILGAAAADHGRGQHPGSASDVILEEAATRRFGITIGGGGGALFDRIHRRDGCRRTGAGSRLVGSHLIYLRTPRAARPTLVVRIGGPRAKCRGPESRGQSARAGGRRVVGAVVVDESVITSTNLLF